MHLSLHACIIFLSRYPRQLSHKLSNCNMLDMNKKTKISTLLRGKLCKFQCREKYWYIVISFWFRMKIIVEIINFLWESNLCPLLHVPAASPLFKGDEKLHRSNALNYEISPQAYISRKVNFLQFLQNWVSNFIIGQKTSSFVCH